MSQIQKNFRRILARIDGRFARSRPASVLVLVIVLLVLMALLGTAFLVTARNDRSSARLYDRNIQIDMLVEGVRNMAIASVKDTSYQRSGPNSYTQYYDDWYSTNKDASSPAGTVDHTWLGSRYPTCSLDNKEAFGTLPGSTGLPRYPVPLGAMCWKGSSVASLPAGATLWINTWDQNMLSPTSAAPNGWVSVPTGSGYAIDQINTVMWPAISGPLVTNVNFEDVGNSANRPGRVRTHVLPTFTTLNGKSYPALTYFSTINNRIETALAASASGNGIADSFLYRLPVGSIDGVTYYAAVRIIDNSSCLNLNTALSSTNDWNFNASASPPPVGVSQVDSTQGYFPLPGFFRSHIGLAELTNSYNSANNAYISGTTPLSAEAAMALQYRSAGQSGPVGLQGSGTRPFSDAGVARTDFVWVNVGDALENCIARRLPSAGMSSAGSSFQVLTWADAAQLAYKFDMVNPNSSPCLSEWIFAPSLYNISATPSYSVAPTVPTGATNNPFSTRPYSSTAQMILQYLGPGTTGASAMPYAANLTLSPPLVMNRRPYFTTRNPVSNAMPAHDLTSLSLNQQKYIAGPYVGADVTPKVSINTADVTAYDYPGGGNYGPSLWLGFYNAMLDALKPPPVYRAPGTAVTAQPSPLASPGLPPVVTQPWGAAQFKSPIRDLNGMWNLNSRNYLSGPTTLMLRSLLASCNAADLRDSDDDVTWRLVPQANDASVVMTAVVNNTATPIRVSAYGNERQCFITRVYVNTEPTAPQFVGGPAAPRANANYVAATPKYNPKGYIAVELYNPNDTALNIGGWTLAVATRGTTYINMAPISNFTGFAAGTVIRPHSYLLLENYLAAPPVGSTAASYRPWTMYATPGTTYSANFNWTAANPFPAGGSIATASNPHAPYVTPNGTGTTPNIANADLLYVPNLHEVLSDPFASKPGGELVILRQLAGDGISGGGAGSGNPNPPVSVSFAAGTTTIPAATLRSLAPVDSFDFTVYMGMGAAATQVQCPQNIPTNIAAYNGTIGCIAFYYTRPNPGMATFNNSTSPNNITAKTNWKFVYPGGWDPSPTVNGLYKLENISQLCPQSTPINMDALWVYPRQEGIAASTWKPNFSVPTQTATSYDTWTVTPTGTAPGAGPPGNMRTWTTSVAAPNYTTSPYNPNSVSAVPYIKYAYSAVFQWFSPWVIPQTYGPYPGVDPTIITAGNFIMPPIGNYGGSYVNEFPPIQLNSTDFGGSAKVLSTVATNRYPFGGFARVGDVLQVPFIGSYYIFDMSDNLIECNPITRDAALADDADWTTQAGGVAASPIPGVAGIDDYIEQVGRFCPLQFTQQSTQAELQKYLLPLSGASSPPLYPPITTIAVGASWRVNDSYWWARNALHYFTATTNPNDDYMPNVNPRRYATGTYSGAWNQVSHAYVGAPVLTTQPVANGYVRGAVNGSTPINEDMSPVEGQININTANAAVLASIPWIAQGAYPTPSGQGVPSPAQARLWNQDIARAIVNYRNTYGPFKSIYDLNKVIYPNAGATAGAAPAFGTNYSLQNGFGDPAQKDYDSTIGDYAPLPNVWQAQLTNGVGTLAGNGVDGTVNDFETRFAAINRVSNLLTTRSDTFTVYVLVQGWTGVGTTAADMVVQRRVALIIDRSTMTQSKNAVNIIPVSSN